jgi:hypothetical protein
MVAHDDPTPGLSARGLLTIALAATVVILLTLRRGAGPGPLARTLGEYTVVFLLAVLLAPPASAPPPSHPPAASRPASPSTSGPPWSRPWTAPGTG